MIKKIILTSTLLTTSLLSNQLDEIIDLYNAKQFNKLCSQATLAKYTSLQNNEQFWTIFSQACIEIDLISNISTPINKLIHSKDARENAVFLSTILYQKKLLYYAIVDDIDISYVRLPRIDHMLSVIFNNDIIGNYTMDGNTI